MDRFHHQLQRKFQEGFINQYVALIDPSKVGMGTNVFVEITLSSQAEDALDAFEAAVTARPEIMSCHLMAGDFDYLLRVVIEATVAISIIREQIEATQPPRALHCEFPLGRPLGKPGGNTVP